MGDSGIPESSSNTAISCVLFRKCPVHDVTYDVCIGCPVHIQQQNGREYKDWLEARKNKLRKSKESWDSVVWPKQEPGNEEMR